MGQFIIYLKNGKKYASEFELEGAISPPNLIIKRKNAKKELITEGVIRLDEVAAVVPIKQVSAKGTLYVHLKNGTLLTIRADSVMVDENARIVLRWKSPYHRSILGGLWRYFKIEDEPIPGLYLNPAEVVKVDKKP